MNLRLPEVFGDEVDYPLLGLQDPGGAQDGTQRRSATCTVHH